ncbi:MAG TPA: DUF4388 domain-containing protein [Polyangiaceae bacterium]
MSGSTKKTQDSALDLLSERARRQSMASVHESEKYVAASDVSSPSGFRAQLRGISIADLIQLNCLSSAASCVRVVSQQRAGCLHFADGRITHAIAGDAMGEDAVLTMLEWTDGCLEPASEVAVARALVTAPWQNLLLRAAQRHDEAQRGEVIPMTQRVPVTNPSIRSVPAVSSDRGEVSARVESEPARQRRESSNSQHVRINAAGKVLSGKGEVEELTALTAFAAHMGQMIGDQLALERLIGIEVRHAHSRTVIAVMTDGQLEAMTATNEGELTSLKQKASL